MRILNGLLVIICSLGLAAVAYADSCSDKAQTQLDLNDCAGASFNKTDKELGQIYKKILTEYADDPKFIEKLETSQRAWLKFRDAEIEALFPHNDEDLYYGSVYPVCNRTWLTTLTKERIAQLKKWINKAKEGDVCSGSIKVKN